MRVYFDEQSIVFVCEAHDERGRLNYMNSPPVRIAVENNHENAHVTAVAARVSLSLKMHRIYEFFTELMMRVTL